MIKDKQFFPFKNMRKINNTNNYIYGLKEWINEVERIQVIDNNVFNFNMSLRNIKLF